MSTSRFHAAITDGPSAPPAIIGVLNVTPDSFSDGGVYGSIDAAVDHAQRMVDEGADAIDVGGESTRPGAERIAEAEQIRRVAPVIERLARAVNVPISIDTTRRAVAETALDAGAGVLNDVSAGRESEGGMLRLAAARGVPIVLMHMLGKPATMQRDPQYRDVVAEVRAFLLERAAAAEAHGVPREHIILDPGIGFGKTTAHNLALLAHLDALVQTGYAIMLGTSRKRFLGEVTGADDPADRAVATAATTALGVAAGVRLFRVHDVKVNREAADAAFAVVQQRRVD